MIRRQNALLIAAAAAGILSGVLYYASAQRTTIFVAARELRPTLPLGSGDLVARQFPADVVPVGAVRDPGTAIGRYLRAPLAAGQLVLEASLADESALFGSGLRPPTGMRAMAVPVTASSALGGAIASGHRVDVIAIPVSGKAPAGSRTELVAVRAIVLDVRGESGRALLTDPGRSGAPDRIGSIVIAIAASDELRLAERIPTSTFVVVLVP